MLRMHRRSVSDAAALAAQRALAQLALVTGEESTKEKPPVPPPSPAQITPPGVASITKEFRELASSPPPVDRNHACIGSGVGETPR